MGGLDFGEVLRAMGGGGGVGVGVEEAVKIKQWSLEICCFCQQ